MAQPGLLTCISCMEGPMLYFLEQCMAIALSLFHMGSWLMYISSYRMCLIFVWTYVMFVVLAD